MRTRRYIAFVLRYRVAVLLATVAISAVSLWRVQDGVFASSVLKLFFGENPDYDAYVRLTDEFADTSVMVIAFDDPNALTPEGMARITRISERIEDVDMVERVDSLASATRVHGQTDTLQIDSYGDLFAKANGTDELRKEIVEDELLRDLLISADGRTVALLVDFHTEPDERPIEELPEIMEEIVAPIVEEGFARDEIHLAGMVPESVEVMRQARFNLVRLFPIAAVVLAIVVFLLFLQLWPVLITSGVASIATLWVFGLAVTIDPEINVMMAMVPAVVMIISFSDVIHLCSAYLNELRAGLGKNEAILKAGGEVGVACFFTSITTLFGFTALAFVPTPLFRLMGVVLGLGVGVALFLAVTLVPIFLFYLPIPVKRLSTSRTLVDNAVDNLTNACLRLATGRPWTVLAGFGVLVAFAVVGMSRLHIETDLPKRLPPDSSLRRAQSFLADRFAGSNFVDLYLELKDEDEQRNWLDPERLAQLAAFQAAVEELPEVDRAYSLVNVMRLLHRELGEAAHDGLLPDSRALAAQYLLLFEMEGGEGLSTDR